MNTIIKEDMEYLSSVVVDYERFSNKTILITGGNGFLPAYMVDFLMYLNNNKLLTSSCKVIVLVRNLTHAEKRFQDYLEHYFFTLIHQDVVQETLISGKINFIIHAASPASPKYYSSDPVGVSLPNIIGTKNILELAREKKVESLLYFSSGEVYGQVDKENIGETDYGYIDPLDLRSCYAESKRMGESLCKSYGHQYGIPCKIVRPFHTYGPGMKLDDGRVFADFVQNIVNNENIILKSKGSAIRAFCYLADAVEGFFKILLDGKSGEAYNIANPDTSISIKNLAELLVKLYPKKELKVEYDFKRNDKYMPS
ncbi:NAD-dependent epimerase/dehydratase family protein, partial [Sulfurovum riftiae]